MKGVRSLSVSPMDMGRASVTKLCHLLLGGDRVASILSSSTSTLVQRSAFAETTCSSVHYNCQMARCPGKRTVLSRIVAVSVDEAQSGEFIAKYC